MITIHELLEDKIFKEFFTTQPIMPAALPKIPYATHWRIYVQRESGGPWGKKEFYTYSSAFKALKPFLKKKCHDATIQSKGIAWQPPVKVVRLTRNGKKLKDPATGKPLLRRIIWQPVLPAGEYAHVWCPYCRRPTTLGWFTQHHAFPKGYRIATPYQRCIICGASERLIHNYA